MKGFGIFSWFSYPLPLKERLALIKDAGFKATSLWWGDEFGDKNRQPETARRLGLDIDYAHAPFDNPNDLWLDGINGDTYLNQLFSCIDDCSRHGIPTAVIHVTRLSSRPPVTSIGMDRIRTLVEHAETRQVNLALENMDSICHLDHIYEQLQSDRLGFCYDSGHENYNHPGVDCLSRYGDKLFAVHLDDNWGDEDTHLLPYDGNINWEALGNKLKKCRDIPYLTLEVDFNRQNKRSRIYQDLSAAAFLSSAYQRLEKLCSSL